MKYSKDKEEQRAKRRRWQKLYRIKNRERILASGRAYNARNRKKISEARRARYASDPAHMKRLDRAYWLKQYGLTNEDYERLAAEQGHRCGICAKPESAARRLSVDHCHATGQVRGLLCMKCNAAIGALGDSVDGVSRALKYLGRFPTAEAAA